MATGRTRQLPLYDLSPFGKIVRIPYEARLPLNPVLASIDYRAIELAILAAIMKDR